MSLPASDSFTDTNWTTLPTHNASWTAINTWNIFSNAVGPNFGEEAYWNADTFDDNQYSQAKLAKAPGNNFIGLLVRFSVGDEAWKHTHYYYVEVYNASPYSGLYKIIDTVTITQLGSNGSEIAIDSVMRLEADGTSITAKDDGTSNIGTQTDASITSGQAGIYGNGDDYNTCGLLDDWEGGNLTSGATPTAYAFGQETPTQGETAVSWATWDNGSAGTVDTTGGTAWGKLKLIVGQEARSVVYDFSTASTRTFTLTENRYGTGSGSATLQIRGGTASFNQDDASPSWVTYTTPTSQEWRYVQVREIKSS